MANVSVANGTMVIPEIFKDDKQFIDDVNELFAIIKEDDPYGIFPLEKISSNNLSVTFDGQGRWNLENTLMYMLKYADVIKEHGKRFEITQNVLAKLQQAQQLKQYLQFDFEDDSCEDGLYHEKGHYEIIFNNEYNALIGNYIVDFDSSQIE